MKAFIIYPTYENLDGQTYIQLFGRLENNESFVTISKFNPYFFIHEKDLSKIKQIIEKYNIKAEKTNLTTFKKTKTMKLSFNCQTDINKAKKEIHDKEIHTFEADVKPHMKFMMDYGLLGTINIEGDYETSERVDRIYKNPELTNSTYNPKLKILSIDIEAVRDSNELDAEDKLICIGISSKNFKKNFFVSKTSSKVSSNTKLKNTIICEDEEECLEKFKQAFLEFDPDIITGWNVIDFDLNYLKEKFQKNKVNFDLGRTNKSVKIRIEENFFRTSKCDIPGRLVLDGLNLIRDPFIKEAPSIKSKKFESYSLENVAMQILGKGKLLKGSGGTRHDQLVQLLKTNPQKVIDYNLLDCELVYEILEKTKTIELGIERSQLTGMPLDKITATIASLDSLYIREARKKSLVSPTTRYQEKHEKNIGGFVMSPKPGIYTNVIVLDFKSLYPSIIRTFNIDPSCYHSSEKQGMQCVKAPNGACFENKEGILPEIIERLHKAREKAKAEKRELSSYAIKTIMNSFWGALASQNSRYFDLKMSNSITSFAQEIIKLTAKKIKEIGYEVIYQDTDSCFVDTNLTKEKANQLGKKIEKDINKFYEEYVKKHHKRESYLELELEKQYLSFIIPQLRGTKKQDQDSTTSSGAKKRYAGLKEIKKQEKGKTMIKEKIEVVGMEAIRGDWTDAAQEFQINLLDKIFHKQEPIKFIKQYILDLRNGKLDKKLVYRKSIRKNLSEYTKTTPPHVKAARKLKKLDSNIIQYYITTEGPEPIQNLTHSIDYEHYIKKQIQPIAIQILSLLGVEFEDIIKGSKQATLF
jgi:DNA polymerase II